MSPPSNKTTAWKGSKSTFRGRTVAFAISGVAVLAVFFFFATLVAGQIVYSEFNPYTFQSRKQFYYRIPILKVVVFPSVTIAQAQAVVSLPVLKHLQPNTSNSRWDLTEVASSNRENIYPAALLVEQLEIVDSDGDNLWEKWSSLNPELAAAIWPLVQQMAIDERYVVMQRFMNDSLDARSPEEIRKLYERLVAPYEAQASQLQSP